MNYNCNFELSQEECLVLLTSLRLLDKLVMGMTIHNENQDELIQNLSNELDSDTTILIKGSRASAMEKIVHKLLN